MDDEQRDEINCTEPTTPPGPEHSTENRGVLRSVSRRTYLGVLSSGVVTGLAGCLGGDEDILTVATWSGGDSVAHFEEAITEPFEQAHDVTVEISPEWAEIISKIQSAPEDDPPYDITVASSPEWFYGDQSELFNSSFDIDNVPNIENAWPVLREDYRTDRLEYGIPHGGFLYIMPYREDQLDFTPTDWSDILRAEVTDSGLDAGYWWVTLYVAALMSDELPGTEELYDPAYHDAVIEMLETLDEHHINDWFTSSADFWSNLEQGVNSIGGDYYHNSKSVLPDYDNVDLAIPTPTTGDFDHYLAVRGTDDKMDLIEEFFNHMLDPAVQQEYHDARWQTYLPATMDVETDDPVLETFMESNTAYEDGIQGFMDLGQIGSEAVDKFDEEFRRITTT